jgi:hypothetical protein
LARAKVANFVFCQLAPYNVFDAATNHGEQYNVRKTYRRSSFLLSRLLANLGASGSTPLLDRFHQPVENLKTEARWRDGLYLDIPEEWDDPYRFFCW